MNTIKKWSKDMMKDRFINKRELAKNIANLIELLKRSLIIAEQEIEKPKEISQQEFQKKKIENNIDKEKIKEPQKRIKKINDKIKKELEEKGIKIENFEKQDYIG